MQQLRVRFQNAEQRRELVTYVIDVFGLRLTSEKSTVVEDGAYSGLQLWRFLQLRYFVDSFSSGSTLGRPSLFAAGAKTEFAGFNAAIVLRRDFGIFIVKTLDAAVPACHGRLRDLVLPRDLDSGSGSPFRSRRS